MSVEKNLNMSYQNGYLAAVVDVLKIVNWFVQRFPETAPLSRAINVWARKAVNA